MGEILVKTHLIITDIHSEFNINWCGRLKDTTPLLKNNKPIFILKSSVSRVEMNTLDIKWLEDVGKKITCPKGRSAVSTDKTFIYIKETNGNEKLMGVITHNRIKTFAPMYDKVGYR